MVAGGVLGGSGGWAHVKSGCVFPIRPKFLTDAVSFIGESMYWIGDHNMDHAIRGADRGLLWLHILFFMCVSLLPFSISVLNAFRQAQVAPRLWLTVTDRAPPAT